MKKHFILFIFITLVATESIFAQRANLDREYFKISYVDLPTSPVIDDSKRTFTSSESRIFLEGFSRVASNGTLDFRFDFHGTKIGEVNVKKITHEKKDKDGKVTSTTYTYTLSTNYSSNGTVSVSNSSNGKNYSFSLKEDDNYSKEDFSSSTKARVFYNDNRFGIRDNYRTKHRNLIVDQINSRINNTYGYVPYTTRTQHFWIIATKKHPEYAKHQEAYEALKAIFDKMKYDEPVNAIAEEVKPWINYFNDVASRFNEDDKKHKKVRYASYYNIAKIYLYLDQPEKAKEYAEKLITNDYDKKDGKRFNSRADELIKDFTVNQIKTRHFEVITEDLSNEPEREIVYAQDPIEESEKAVAFLITAANDTLQTTIALDELTQMSAKANFFDTDNGVNEVTAAESKKIVLTTGDTYKVSSFASSIASDKAVSPKFVKSIYEGNSISLFEHMGKEYILKFKTSEEGISTMSKDFVFGFKKKLESLTASCETLKAKISAGEFKNTLQSLTAYAKEYDACVK